MAFWMAVKGSGYQENSLNSTLISMSNYAATVICKIIDRETKREEERMQNPSLTQNTL